MGKGADFERGFCRDLSLWWTSGVRDDVFWRTSISGGRATVRAKSGHQTAGGCGDLTAVHPMGAPLLELLTVELKKGYGKRGTAFNALDNLPRGRNPVKPCQWEEFVAQARRDSDLSGAPYWLLVHSRPMRAVMVFVPWSLARHLPGLRSGGANPSAMIHVGGEVVVALRWETLKALVKPSELVALRDKWKSAWKPVIRVKRVVEDPEELLCWCPAGLLALGVHKSRCFKIGSPPHEELTGAGFVIPTLIRVKRVVG